MILDANNILLQNMESIRDPYMSILNNYDYQDKIQKKEILDNVKKVIT